MKKRAISILLSLMLILTFTAPYVSAVTAEDVADAAELVIGEQTTAVFTSSGQYVYFKFTPEKTCKYAFYSSVDGLDPKGFLYKSDYSQITSHDDINYSGGNKNFRIEYVLTAGETYYLGVKLFGSNSGEVPVYVDQIHSFKLDSAINEPTCTEAGTGNYVCEHCGYSHEDSIPARGHNFETWTTTTPATCTEAGVESSTCTRCTEVSTRPVAALGHNFETWTTSRPATCTEAGEEASTCTHCTEVSTRPTDPLGHDWVNPVPNGDGTHKYSCSRCTEKKDEDCSYETTFECGFAKHVCTECEYSYIEEAEGEQSIALWDFEKGADGWSFINKDGDNYNWSVSTSLTAHGGNGVIYSESYHNGALTPDNWAVSPAISLSGCSNATLSLWASGRVNSSYCNEVFAIYAGTSPEPNKMTKLTEDLKARSNYNEYTADLSDFAGDSTVYIAIRHYKVTDQFEIRVDDVEIKGVYPASCQNHDLVLIPASDAACKIGKHTQPFYQCSECGRTFADAEGNEPLFVSETITSPAIGHDWGEIISGGDGTHYRICSRCSEEEREDCTYHTVVENGIARHTCTKCNYSYTDDAEGELSLAFWGFENGAEGWTFIDKDNDGNNWYVDTDNTANSGKGSICSDSYNSGALTPDNWAVSPAISLCGCTEAEVKLWATGKIGSQYYCQEVFAVYAGTSSDPDGMTKLTDDITTGADYAEYTADLSDFAGDSTVYIAIRHYNVTDLYYINVDDVEVKGVLAESCQNHTLVPIPASDASCTEVGRSKSYYKCSECGRTYLDAEGKNPVLVSDFFIPALGHAWGSPVYSDNGKHTYECSRCHETKDEDCSYVTETQNGVEEEHCEKCGHIVSSEPVSGESVVASWDFEENTDGWTFIDSDGDGYNWELSDDDEWKNHNESVGCICSASYINNVGALTPDNWAMSPRFSVFGMNNPKLTFWAVGQDNNDFEENFAVYAGTAPDITTMTKLTDDLITSKEYQMFTVDLSDYTNSLGVYIAFRHYDVTNMYWLNVDDVTVEGLYPESCENGSHSMTLVSAKAANCTENGYSRDFYICSECGRYFLDEEGNVPVIPSDVIIPAHHELTAYAAVEPTRTEAGSSAYWQCSVCGKYFSDKYGINEIEEGAWVIPATGYKVSYDDTVRYGSVYAAKNSYQPDEPVVLIVDPFNGCSATEVFYTDSEGTKHIIEPVDGEYTFNMPEDDITVSGVFVFDDGVSARQAGYSLSLDGDIGVNFYMLLDDELAASQTAYMQFTVPNGGAFTTQKVMVKDAVKTTVVGYDLYAFRCSVSAKEMTSVIRAQIFDGDTAVSTEYTYSVEEYAEYLIENAEEMDGFSLNHEYSLAVPLVKTLLNYGAASQILFNCNTEKLANASLDDSDKEFECPDLNYFVDNKAELVDGIILEGATLSLKSELSFTLYFSGIDSDNIPEFTCTDDDTREQKTVETFFNEETGLCVVRVRGINYYDSEDRFILQFQDGTVSFCPIAYCKAVISDEGTDESFKNVMTALCCLSFAAYEYEEAINILALS